MGIGINNPDEALVVKDSGDAYIKIVTGEANKRAGIQFVHNSTSTDYGGDGYIDWRIQTGSLGSFDTNASKESLFFSSNRTGTTHIHPYAMVISYDSNVGIGINAPDNKLEVAGDISANKIYIKDISATDISAVNISANDASFNNITTIGKISIGNEATNPQSLLHIYKNTDDIVIDDISYSNILRLTSQYESATHKRGPLITFTNKITGNPGSTNAGNLNSVTGDDSEYYISAIGSHQRDNNLFGGSLSFYTKPVGNPPSGTELTERMTITHEGKVGIGVVEPDFKLEVDGDISANKICVKDISATDISAVNISASSLTLNGEPVTGGQKVNGKNQTLLDILTQQPEMFTYSDLSFNQSSTAVTINWNYDDIVAKGKMRKEPLARVLLASEQTLKKQQLPFINKLYFDISGNSSYNSGTNAGKWINYSNLTIGDNENYNIHHTSFAFPATASGEENQSDVKNILSKQNRLTQEFGEKILQKR